MQLFLNLSSFLSPGFQISCPRMRWATPYKPSNTAVTAKVMVWLKRSCPCSSHASLNRTLPGLRQQHPDQHPSGGIQAHRSLQSICSHRFIYTLQMLVWKQMSTHPGSTPWESLSSFMPSVQIPHTKIWTLQVLEEKNPKTSFFNYMALAIWSWLYSHFSATA